MRTRNEMHAQHDKDAGATPRTTAARPASLDDERGVIEGYASIFGGAPDSDHDVVEPGAFAPALAAHQAAGTMPMMVWQHDIRKPIGRWTKAYEDARGLRVVGQLNLDTQAGREARAHLKAGDLAGLSIGWAGTRKANADGSRTITKVVFLPEISVVTLGANPRARVDSVKAAGAVLSCKADLVDLLRKGGLAKAAARKIADGGWAGLAGEDPEHARKDGIANLTRRLSAMNLEL